MVEPHQISELGDTEEAEPVEFTRIDCEQKEKCLE